MRISEALAVRVKDINSDRLQIKVENGKGHKDRYVDIPMELIEILREYYIIYKPSDRLFLRRKQTRDQIYKRCK